jgi:heme exporter protein A
MGAPGPFQDKPSLRVEGLSLSRGGRVLFENLSFAAEPGAYIELRGANGAGKTSLLRALAGFLKPSAGAITYDNVAEPALAMHYVAHANALKPTESVRDHLRYWSGLLGGTFDENLQLSMVGLEGLGGRAARTLSQGQARRLALSRMFCAVRPILLLDEPAAGLDDSGRDLVRGLITAYQANGDMVIAAVHEPLGIARTKTLWLGAT